MSEYPRKGDRVRVVYEGEVTETDKLQRHFKVDSGHTLPFSPPTSIEITRPRAYPPGSIIQGRLYTWIVTNKGTVALDAQTGEVRLTDCSVTGADLAQSVRHDPETYKLIHESAA